MSAVPTSTEFLRDPEAWIASPGCVCRSSGVGLVNNVDKAPMVYAAGAGGALPGLTPEETAILAGVLTGLATFLFLLLPILCCLCPACCGYGKKKGMAASSKGHREGNLQRSESFWTAGSWGGAGGEKMDYENLYGVDMKLPRPLVDNSNGGHFDSKVHELQDGGWEGVDMSRDEIDAAIRASHHGGGETMAQTGMVAYADQGTSGIAGSGANGSAVYSTVDRSRGGGDEIITEYTTTRRMDMHIAGMNQAEADDYYARTYGQSMFPRYRRADPIETVLLDVHGETDG